MPTRSTEIKGKSRLIRHRFFYITAAVVVVLAGLASRRYRERLPAFLAEYAGDTLWALMVFLLVIAMLAEWIDAIRQTTLGGLVLGLGFLWSDLVLLGWHRDGCHRGTIDLR